MTTWKGASDEAAPVDPQYLEEWRADGLQIFILENTIPEWVVDIGLTKPWCWAQDAWKLLRLW